jgi:ATP-dependent Clp protease ATP-binding subunit ClpX
LLDVQFELPSRKDVTKCVVTRDTIVKGINPTLVTEAAKVEPGGAKRIGRPPDALSESA